MNKRGKLLVLSGPSGCGKGTVLRELMRGRDDMAFSVSVTTRAPRPGEVNGREYYFVSRERFEEMVEEGELLEHAEFVGNCYGTPKTPVLQQLESGRHVLLDIEVQGAAQVKKAMPEAILVFLVPPSIEELERRLRGRGTETEEKIQKRLKTAEYEMTLADEYDYTVVNDEVARAAAELAEILKV